jgi:hypothetical protein
MGKMCCATHHAKLFSFAPRRFADSLQKRITFLATTAALRTTPQCNDFVMNAAADAELMRCEDSGGATHSRAHDTHTRDSRRSIAAQHAHGQSSATHTGCQAPQSTATQHWHHHCEHNTTGCNMARHGTATHKRRCLPPHHHFNARQPLLPLPFFLSSFRSLQMRHEKRHSRFLRSSRVLHLSIVYLASQRVAWAPSQRSSSSSSPSAPL